MEVRLNYQPRPYFKAFHARNQRWSFVLAHRRAGKSFALAADMVVRALRTRKEKAQFGYCAPSLKQARTIIWKHFKTILGAQLLSRCKVSETTLSITLPNGAEIRVFGLNDPDSLRGFYLDGIILDESQDVSQDLISTVIIPALTDRRGWFVMAGTPKGLGNSFYRTYLKAKQFTDKWFLLELKASQTGILSEEDLQAAREELSEEDYEQEFEISFLSGSRGAVYANYVHQLVENGGFMDFDHIKSAPVQTVWDLGWNDLTTVWFFQVVNGRIDIVDYHEAHHQAIGAIIEEVQEIAKKKKYQLKDFWLPHDAYSKSLETGKSLVETFWKYNLNTRRVPEIGIRSGISALRTMMKFMRFHKTKTFQGVEALKAYKYLWSDRNQCFSSEPVHDWSSHASDAARYLAIAVKEYQVEDSLKVVKLDTVHSGMPTIEQAREHAQMTLPELVYLGYAQEEESWL